MSELGYILTGIVNIALGIYLNGLFDDWYFSFITIVLIIVGGLTVFKGVAGLFGKNKK